MELSTIVTGDNEMTDANSSSSSSIRSESVASVSSSGRYSSDSFVGDSDDATERSSVELVHRTDRRSSSSSSPHSDDNDRDDAYDDDAYDDDAFEAEDTVTLQVHSNVTSYNADSFDALYDDDSFATSSIIAAAESPVRDAAPGRDSNGCELRCESSSSSLDATAPVQTLANEAENSAAATQHIDLQPREWCTRKLLALATRKHESASHPPAHRSLPRSTVKSMCELLEKRSLDTVSSAAAYSHRPYRRAHALASILSGDAVDALVDRAQTARWLSAPVDRLLGIHALDSDELQCDDAAVASRPTNARLATFCAAKRAHLEGTFATLQLSDNWVRTCTANAFDPNEMSIATLAIVADMVAAQRRVLAAGAETPLSTGKPAPAPLFRCLQTHAPRFDETVASTQQCLRESRALRAQAARVLQPCDFDPHNM